MDVSSTMRLYLPEQGGTFSLEKRSLKGLYISKRFDSVGAERMLVIVDRK